MAQAGASLNAALFHPYHSPSPERGAQKIGSLSQISRRMAPLIQHPPETVGLSRFMKEHQVILHGSIRLRPSLAAAVFALLWIFIAAPLPCAVAGPPQIAQQPDLVEAVDDNGDLWLQVAGVSSASPYTYQWQRRSNSAVPYADIPGATESTLFLRGVHAADAGDYRVVVSNADGSTPSDVAAVVIRNLRDAADSPALAWRTRGTALWATQTTDTHDGVDALKHSPPNWEWSTLETIVSIPGRLTFWLKMNGGHVDLWMNGELQTISTPAGQWVQHTVLLPNDWDQWVSFSLQQEADGASAVLDQVQFTPVSELPPIITEQPVPAWTDPGARVEFSVDLVEQGGPFTYQWQKKVGAGSFVDIPGSISDELEIENAQTGDVAEYRTVITNAAGSTTSEARALTLVSLQDSLDSPLAWWVQGNLPWVKQTAVTHDGVDALAWQGAGNLRTYLPASGIFSFWMRSIGGANLEVETSNDEPSFDSTNGAWVQQSILIYDGSQNVDFAFHGSNPGTDGLWIDQAVFTPASQLPPIFKEQPVAAWPELGARVEFEARLVDGGGPYTYQWQKRIGAGSFADMPGEIGENLVFESTQASDVADYRVVATNPQGSTTSEARALTLSTLKTSLDSPLNWWTQGAQPWLAQSTVTHDGVDALAWQGDATGDIRTFLPESGVLSFWMRTTGSYLQVELHDQEPTYGSTHGDWVQQFITVAGGAQDVDFDYLGQDNGTDAAWIDQVVFTPASQLPPIIVEDPDFAWADLGARVEFSVEALDGGGPYTYQWQKKVGDGSFTDISGANAEEFVIAGAQAGDVAEYRAIVTNPRGSATSQARMLNLVTLNTSLDSPLSWWVQGDLPWAPQSTISHDGVDALAWQGNDTGNLQIDLPGSGVLSFWMRTIGANLEVETDHDEVSFDSTNGAWVQQFIPVYGGPQNVDFDFHGSDTWSDGAWIDQVVFTPASQLPPILKEEPDFAWADPGARVEFLVELVDGGGPYTYRWQKKVGAGSFADIPGATADTLVIDNAQAGDVAEYRTVVTNAHGSTTSATRTLTLVTLKTSLDSPLSWWVQGDLPWVAQSAVTHDGVDALAWQGNDTGHVRTRLPGAGVLSFWMRTIGNVLQVTTNAGVQNFDSTRGAWVQQFITISGGAQEVDFDFDGVDNTSDGGWIDQVVFTPAPISTYTEWASSYFTASEMQNPLIAGIQADADQDGIANGVEAALGSNPRLAGAGGSPFTTAITGIGANGHLVLIFDMPGSPLSGLKLEVQETSSLTTIAWTTVASKTGASSWTGPASVQTTTLPSGRIHVEASGLAPLGTPTEFLRLKVSEVP